MNWLAPWRRRIPQETLDPELLALFAAGDGFGPSPATHARARARFAAVLAADGRNTTGLRRRLAFGALGGSGLWASVVGVAAAHKAAAAVAGAALVVSGAVAFEGSGVGQQIRETVGLEHSDHEEQSGSAGIRVDGDGTVGPPAESNSPVRKEPGGEDLPGNLSIRETASGGYSLRSQLIAVNVLAGTVSVSVVGETTPVTLPLDPAAMLTGPGLNQHDASITDLALLTGRLVQIDVECEAGAPALLPGLCRVTTLHVLGDAGVGPDVDVTATNADITPEPGNSGNAPGRSSTPGEASEPPGKSGDAPGQTKDNLPDDGAE